MSKSYFKGKDIFILPDGSTYHLEVKEGDVHPRILTVGAAKRAAEIVKLFDKDKPIKEIHSNRDMHTYSGHYKGVGVSVIAIGMGAPMMDFMLREASVVQHGKMAIIRLGTCGIFSKNHKPGTVITCGKGSMYLHTNYSYFSGAINIKNLNKQSSEPYILSNATPADTELNKLLCENLKKADIPHLDGLNCSAETFYSCQGRKHPNFSDLNDNLNQLLIDNHVDSVEMETHQLLHLASLRNVKCHATACAIGVVNRVNHEMTDAITSDCLNATEQNAGRACLEALISFKL